MKKSWLQLLKAVSTKDEDDMIKALDALEEDEKEKEDVKVEDADELSVEDRLSAMEEAIQSLKDKIDSLSKVEEEELVEDEDEDDLVEDEDEDEDKEDVKTQDSLSSVKSKASILVPNLKFKHTKDSESNKDILNTYKKQSLKKAFDNAKSEAVIKSLVSSKKTLDSMSAKEIDTVFNAAVTIMKTKNNTLNLATVDSGTKISLYTVPSVNNKINNF